MRAMIDERMTVAAIVAERPDMQPTGEFYLELAVTGAVVAAVPPHGRREVAGFLRAILSRAPVAEGAAYEAHRMILGALLSELESAAIGGALDGSDLALADLRDPAISQRERELIRSTRDWAAGEQSRRREIAHARIDELLEESEPLHTASAARLEAAVAHAQELVAAPAIDVDDASAWLA